MNTEIAFVDNWKSVITATVTLSPTNKLGKTLDLVVRGNEAKVGWHFPTLRYAVNRVALHFHPKGCLLPEEDWAFDAVALNETEIAQEHSETIETNATIDGSWAGAIAASVPNGSVKSSRSQGTKKGLMTGRRFSTLHRPILAHGTAENPIWSVTSEQAQKPLLGTLIKQERFCRAEPLSPEPKVKISFEIPYDALLFRRTDGSFTGNRFGIVRLLLRAALCERRQQICEIEVE